MKTQIINHQDVVAQMERFDQFIVSANLSKIGERMMFMNGHENKDGRYNGYVYLLRVLSILANVGGCYSHPNYQSSTWSCYRDILERKALDEYLKLLSIRKDQADLDAGLEYMEKLHP